MRLFSSNSIALLIASSPQAHPRFSISFDDSNLCRSFMELFHLLGVYAVGDTRWDSECCLGVRSFSCSPDQPLKLNYELSDVHPSLRNFIENDLRRDIERYKSDHPFPGHCGSDSLACNCGCYSTDTPLQNLGQNATWGFKQPETIFHLPYWKKIFPKNVFILVVRDGRDVGA